MNGHGLHDNDNLPSTIVSETIIAEQAADALANVVRRGQATGDVLDMLGLGGVIAS